LPILVVHVGDAARHAGREIAPVPSTTAVAPDRRTAKRSPATPLKKASPVVAPYSAVLPMMMFCVAIPRKSMLGRTTMRPPDKPLPV
jgi:hypothetical protein